MPSRRWSHAARLLVCAVAIDALAAAAAPAPAPCSLLTSAQVAAALGGTFGTGEPIGKTGCSWTSEKPHVIVTVSLWPPTEWDRVKANPLGGKTIPVSGLGEDAFYATIAQYTVLYVKKGSTVYLFKVYGVKDQSKQMSAEKTLALDALQKL
jgi:hypothetical protein